MIKVTLASITYIATQVRNSDLYYIALSRCWLIMQYIYRFTLPYPPLLYSPGLICPWTQNAFMTLCLSSSTILKRLKKSMSCLHGGTGKHCPLNAPIQSLNLPAARSSPIRTQNAPPAKIVHWQNLRKRELRGGNWGISRLSSVEK